MADVQLNIAGRDYVVTCRDGEESHLKTLAAAVDAKAQEAGGASGGLNESRLLLFAGLLLADEVHEMRASGKGSLPTASPAASSMPDADIERMAETLEKLADRIERLAAGLE
jgi:cell division protein ZapA